MIVTGLQSGLVATSATRSEGASNLGTAGVVYDSCEISNCKAVSVLVANLGAQALVVPLYTKLASVVEATMSTAVGLESELNGLQVSVNQVLMERVVDQGEVSLDTIVGEEEESSTHEMFVFADGTSYQLPPGLSLTNCVLTNEQREQVARLIQKHDDVFSKNQFDVGFCDRVPHKIPTIDERPTSEPYRRIPPHCVQEVRDLLQHLLDQGIIRHSASAYASPIVLVRKNDGSLRLCVDFRKLNSKTVRDSFPLPRIEESLEALRGAKYFTSLDLAHGYHHVAMDTGSVEKTSFRVPFGLYEFTRMHFGLANAPGTFQRVMEMCIGDMNLSELLIYLDDILIFSSSVEEHLQRPDRVFARLTDFGLKIKGKKCCLFREKVVFLRHVVSVEGISVDHDKIQRIREWPIPRTVEHLRSFLGLAGYYRRFVQGFSRIAAPLHALIPPLVRGKFDKRARGFVWTADAQFAFEQLKQALVSAHVLAYHDFTLPFVIEVDASLNGLGACLAQEDKEGRRHPVVYASRGLRGVEAKYPDYSSFKLELIALKGASQKSERSERSNWIGRVCQRAYFDSSIGPRERSMGTF